MTQKEEPEVFVPTASAQALTEQVTEINADGSTKVTTTETLPDGSKQSKTTIYPAGAQLPGESIQPLFDRCFASVPTVLVKNRSCLPSAIGLCGTALSIIPSCRLQQATR